jgi:hypothetical protein
MDTTTRSAVAVTVAVMAVGCSGTHVAMDDAGRSPSPDAAASAADAAISLADAAPAPDAFRAPTDPALERCLLEGGRLVEVARVFNNDQEDHGALRTFGISPTGQLAAAGEDGTLKFWALDATLLGTIDGSLLTYGSETGASPITDLAFRGDHAIAGDVRGLVAELAADGTYFPLGGTTPDVPIRAVALHEASGRLAHAQRAEGVAPLVVRAADGTVTEITETLPEVNDLLFTSDGSLWVAGASLGAPRVEVRDAADPSRILRTLEPTSPEGGAVMELSSSLHGETVAMLTTERVRVDFGEGFVEIPFPGWAEIVGRSVALTPEGGVVLTLDSQGELAAHAAREERSLARVDTRGEDPGALPVAVRVDASGTLAVVGRRDAWLLAYACEP